jgi:DNA-binding response OmpR family regulator
MCFLAGLGRTASDQSDTLPDISSPPEKSYTPSKIRHVGACSMEANHKRILCVEADDDSLDLLRIILNFEGFEVVSARTITAAILLAQQERFALYLVGSGLPDGEGLDFIRGVRVLDSQMPIILISGRAYPAEVEKGLKAGANAYLVKPVDNEEILRTVKSLTSLNEKA